MHEVNNNNQRTLTLTARETFLISHLFSTTRVKEDSGHIPRDYHSLQSHGSDTEVKRTRGTAGGHLTQLRLQFAACEKVEEKGDGDGDGYWDGLMPFSHSL